MKDMTVSGSVAPGFESIHKLFTQNMQRYEENAAQLCIYHRGQQVVDLWAHDSDHSHFDANALINIFSSGKSLESIAMAWLVAEGHLTFSAKVTDYWADYGANGKDEQTIADVMRHEAGLASLDQSINPNDLHRDQIKANRIGCILAAQSPFYQSSKDEDRREYHALSRGWIVNEIFRRAHPQGFTLGEFYADFVNPLLDTDIHIGVSDENLCRIEKLVPLRILKHLRLSAWPLQQGRRTHHHLPELLLRIANFGIRAWRAQQRKRPPPFKAIATIAGFNDPRIIQGETASANTHASARSLARLGSTLAMGAEPQQPEWLSQAAWQALHDEPIDRVMGVSTAFTQGGVCEFKALDAKASSVSRALHLGREGFYGWMGLGGSIFQWHPGKQLSFAFVPATLHLLDVVNERGKTLQAELLKCVTT